MNAPESARQSSLPCQPKVIHHNPSAADLRAWTDAMPTSRTSEFDNPNVTTKVLARSAASTFIVTDDPASTSYPTITRAEYESIAKAQNDYIADKEMVVVEGYIGNDAQEATAARLIIEKDFSNIAGMQNILYFHLDDRDYAPHLQVVYTPAMKAPKRSDGSDFPEQRLIAVDLENNTTRVMNSDYFGESKKGGLRMWNKLIHDKGGLPMHAGAKIIPVDGKKIGMLIVGLSGTGKTTTTFTRQNDSNPVQDDFIALMPSGKVLSTENGCFAKTYGLDPEFEPTIHAAVCKPEAYLENVSMTDDGKVDFFDESYTKNGRAVFAMADVEGAVDASELTSADCLLILNRNENIIPAVARLTPEQAAAYFMLGETTGTAAGGKDEEGKALRVPGTNPFFPLPHAEQGNRFLELLEKRPMDVYLLNTGRVGGGDSNPQSKKVKIPHSSAVVKGIAEGTITWTTDPDFGYEIAEKVPGVGDEDLDLLQPKRLYEDQGRLDEYTAKVAQLKTERVAYMAGWPGIDSRLVDAVK